MFKTCLMIPHHFAPSISVSANPLIEVIGVLIHVKHLLQIHVLDFQVVSDLLCHASQLKSLANF